VALRLACVRAAMISDIMIPSPAATPVDLIHLGPTSPRRRVSPLSAPNTLPLCSLLKFVPRHPFLNARVDVTQ
jgi:hypothetical protein